MGALFKNNKKGRVLMSKSLPKIYTRSWVEYTWLVQ